MTAVRGSGRRSRGRASSRTVDPDKSVGGVDRDLNAAVDSPLPGGTDVPVGLTSSAVYRRMPVGERGRLDRAIILRPEGLGSLEAIARHFKLAEKYDISIAMLRTYAGKLEELVRPAVTSHVLAGVLGCLPESYRKQIVAGSEVLLVSKVMQALNGDGGAPGAGGGGNPAAPLSVADLAKLASILVSLARRRGRGDRAVSRTNPRGEGEPAEPAGACGTPSGPIKLAETVRLLYGLSWPPENGPALPNPPQDSTEDAHGNQPDSGVGLGTKACPYVHPAETQA